MSLRRCFSALRRKSVDWNQHADFFKFTRGRFVSHEADEMARRHIRFDMNELCKAAGAAVGGACVKVDKFADGMYNKAFLFTMENGEQVVAKVPNPNAGLAHFTTASEVATMDFMRSTLDTPAPRVLAWDCSSSNAVKAEYIIMEKAPGVQLSTVWPSMKFDQKLKVMKTVARYQKSWAKTSFDRIGSLYYAQDLDVDDRKALVYADETGKKASDARFSIGPIVGREWNDHDRASLNCDRGPWTTSESYRRATIERDIKATTNLRSLPKSLTMLCGPSLYQSTPEKKLRACIAASQALPRILPQESWASTFHLWHDDLHDENIFVDTEDHSTVVSIIDWQSSFVGPLFDHIIMPAFLQYDGPPVKGTERPITPQLSDLSPDQEAVAIKVYDQQLLVSGYKFLLQNTNKTAFGAQLFEESDAGTTLNACRNIYEAGEGYCLISLANLEDRPVDFSEGEVESIHEDAEKIMMSLQAMDTIKKGLGDLFPEKGVVRPDQYDEAKAALRRVKAQILEEAAGNEEKRRRWEEVWPFDD